MTVSSWQSTETATLARSTAWCAADRPRIELAPNAARAGSAMMLVRRRYSLVCALFGVGAGVLASCADDQPRPAATTASVEAPKPPPPKDTVPQAMPRPARKPTPPHPPESSVPDPGDEAVGMMKPEPPAGASASTAEASPQV